MGLHHSTVRTHTTCLHYCPLPLYRLVVVHHARFLPHWFGFGFCSTTVSCRTRWLPVCLLYWFTLFPATYFCSPHFTTYSVVDVSPHTFCGCLYGFLRSTTVTTTCSGWTRVCVPTSASVGTACLPVQPHAFTLRHHHLPARILLRLPHLPFRYLHQFCSPFFALLPRHARTASPTYHNAFRVRFCCLHLRSRLPFLLHTFIFRAFYTPFWIHHHYGLRWFRYRAVLCH